MSYFANLYQQFLEFGLWNASLDMFAVHEEIFLHRSSYINANKNSNINGNDSFNFSLSIESPMIGDAHQVYINSSRNQGSVNSACIFPIFYYFCVLNFLQRFQPTHHLNKTFTVIEYLSNMADKSVSSKNWFAVDT